MPTDRRPRALVIGGAGFLGSHVCESLLGEGYEVVCLDNFATGSMRNIETLMAEPRFTVLVMDISQGGPEAGGFDLVVHLASQTSPFQYSAMPMDIVRASSEGTFHALEAARRSDARFVLVSTACVYGDAAENPLRENYVGSVLPATARTASQTYDGPRFAEALAVAYRRTYRANTGILRIFNTYGPAMRGDDGGVVATFVQQALDGEPLTVTGDGRQTRSLCYVGDSVDAIVGMGTSLHPGPINIGHHDELTILALAEQIIQLSGSSSEIRFVDRDAADLQARRPDVSAAYEVLGWQPRTSLADGLAWTLQSFAVTHQTKQAQKAGTGQSDPSGSLAPAALAAAEF